jgi:valyl-tRNA synthetase
VKFSEERVEGYRHFVNKLWNASRFILMNAGEAQLPDSMDPEGLDLGSSWILSRLGAAAEEVNQSLTDYRFNDAAGAVYHFIWHELCDWYIEMVKPVLYGEAPGKEHVQECLLFVLDKTLRLLHPFMPYVTEEIWQTIPGARAGRKGSGRSITVAAFPASLPREAQAEAEMAVLMETVLAIRNIRGELNLAPSLELKAHIKTLSPAAGEVLRKDLMYLRRLARADVAEIGSGVTKPRGSAAAVRTSVEVFVPLEGLLNVDLEVDRLRKEEEKIDQTITQVNRKLRNEDFLKRAPVEIVAKEKEKLDDCLLKKQRIQEHISKLQEAGGKGHG